LFPAYQTLSDPIPAGGIPTFILIQRFSLSAFALPRLYQNVSDAIRGWCLSEIARRGSTRKILSEVDYALDLL